jgi:hypothetical protein
MPAARHGWKLKSVALAACAAGAALACAHLMPLEINGPTTGTFSIQIGEALDFHMQAVGPGSYESPPAMLGTGLQFLSVTAGSSDPGGIVQIFHFKGIATGMTIITFQGGPPSGTSLATVIDTVFVQQ